MTEQKETDYWVEKGGQPSIFVHYGKGYVTTVNEKTDVVGVGCIGKYPPEESIINATAGSPQNPPDNAPAPQNDVAKIDINDKPHDVKHSKLKGGVFLQHRGRPKKEGEVHRTTEWRRKKELQGVLL